MRKSALLVLCLPLLLVGCAPKDELTEKIINRASEQLTAQCHTINAAGTFINPKSVQDGKICYIPLDDWCSGFFPGTLLEMYRLTGDSMWLQRGLDYTEHIDSIKHIRWHHDVGFMVMSSFGQAWRITHNPAYRDVIITAAQSLSTRFRPVSGVIQSWDEDRGWQGTRGWLCPTIIDNMINLELLFEATQLTGDSSYWHIAVSHADTTMKYHFRDDYSTCHVVDYDKVNGGIRSRCAAQGYADSSCWSRGEAWALYGYAFCYRYTGDEKYLDQCRKIYGYMFDNPNMPSDLVPYWDYNAPDIPDAYRDASAAAVMASALYELSEWIPEYRHTADRIMESLASDAYLAKAGTNGNFILMHSVGSIPHGNEIDAPLNYADYYLLEALCRRNNK